jgi:hypothetical protein
LNYLLFYADTSWEVPMSLQVASFIFGALLLAVCILGGNFQFKDISVGRVNFGIRIVAGIAGLVFIVIGLVSGPLSDPSPGIGGSSSGGSPSPRVSPSAESGGMGNLPDGVEARWNGTRYVCPDASYRRIEKVTIATPPGSSSPGGTKYLCYRN